MDELIRARYDELLADMLARRLIRKPNYSSTGAPIWNLNYRYRITTGSGSFEPNDFIWTLASLDVAAGWLPQASSKNDMIRSMADTLMTLANQSALQPDIYES